jgi:hypothetical protein
MIRHIVMLELQTDYAPDALGQIMAGLNGLQNEIAGYVGFEHGPNADFEGQSAEYPYGFICSFKDEAALQIYAAHPTHAALGAQLLTMTGGTDGIMVMDLVL